MNLDKLEAILDKHPEVLGYYNYWYEVPEKPRKEVIKFLINYFRSKDIVVGNLVFSFKDNEIEAKNLSGKKIELNNLYEFFSDLEEYIPELSEDIKNAVEAVKRIAKEIPNLSPATAPIVQNAVKQAAEALQVEVETLKKLKRLIKVYQKIKDRYKEIVGYYYPGR